MKTVKKEKNGTVNSEKVSNSENTESLKKQDSGFTLLEKDGEEITASPMLEVDPKAIKPKIIYNLDDVVLEQINLDKNLVLRIIENNAGKHIDIRKFYKNYPTKKGVRLSYGTFQKLKNILKD